MKIAIVVQGRFHAFSLGRALLDRHHDVTIFTNYPGWAVERFGFPRDRVRSFWLHGVLVRTLGRLPLSVTATSPADAFVHVAFGRWARRQLMRERFDVVHAWSGISEEILSSRLPGNPLRYLMRGSSHIRTQARLLAEEEARSGVRQDRPSAWKIERESKEYVLADAIVTLSTFALNTFIAEGVTAQKVRLLLTAARLASFRPLPTVIFDRRERILAREPLRVLFVGTLSFRKGLLDLEKIVGLLPDNRFQFRFVGAQLPEAASVLSRMPQNVVLVTKIPQASLPTVYEWGDVFVFPTIEDGSPQVLGQAAESALPILTTPNSSGPDFIRENESGWVLPIRSPASFAERLFWCDVHRPELAAMVDRVYSDFRPRGWADVAADFEDLCRSDIERRSAQVSTHTDE